MDKGTFLDSWKGISKYLGRNIRTCRNWELEFGLPVHRLEGAEKSRVFAFTGEIDAWRELKGRLPENGEKSAVIGDGANVKIVPATITMRRSVRTRLITGLAVAPLLAYFATAVYLGHSRPSAGPPVGRFTIDIEPGHWLDGTRTPWDFERPLRPAMAISHDGRSIVYCAIEGPPGPKAESRLFLRQLDRTEATSIAGTAGGINPFFSPDDRWVGFWADGRLKKIPLAGGVATDLCGAPLIFGASWGPGGILFSDAEYSGLSWVSEAGGKPEVLTKPDPEREEYSHRLPSWLPGGKSALFTVTKHLFDRSPSTALIKRGSGKWRVLLEDAADARYVPTGHIVFMRRGTLMAIRFDPKREAVSGQAVPLINDVIQGFCVASSGHTCAGQFSVSDTGNLVYAAGGLVPDEKNSLVWVDMEGRAEPVTDHLAAYRSARLSPDGHTIAYSTNGSRNQIYVYDPDRGTHTPLTIDGVAVFPLWSPDGEQILYSIWGAQECLYRQPLDRMSASELLARNEDSFSSWSTDGHTVAIVRLRPETLLDIAMMDVRSGEITPYLDSPATEVYPEFSPDGRWIAYASDESGRREIYVRAFPGPGAKQMISISGGSQPLWASDGKRLYYRDGEHVWAVDVRTNGAFRAGQPRKLFDETPYGRGFPIRTYDLSPDGKRFLMIREERRAPAPVTELALVENWFGEVRRLTRTVAD